MHQKTPGGAAQLSACLMFHNNMWLRQAMKKNYSVIGKDYTDKVHFLHAAGRKNTSKDDEDFLDKILFLNIPLQTS